MVVEAGHGGVPTQAAAADGVTRLVVGAVVDGIRRPEAGLGVEDGVRTRRLQAEEDGVLRGVVVEAEDGVRGRGRGRPLLGAAAVRGIVRLQVRGVGQVGAVIRLGGS